MIPAPMREEFPCASQGNGKGGHSLSQKRMAPFRSPKRKVYIASFGLEELHGLRNRVPAMGWFYTTWFASIFAVALPAIRYPYAISVYFEFYQSCFFLPTRLCRAQVLHSGGIKVIRARDRQSETFLFGVQKGDILFREREYPPFTRSPRGRGGENYFF